MLAKHPGICPACGLRIRTRQEIERGLDGWEHVECPLAVRPESVCSRCNYTKPCDCDA